MVTRELIKVRQSENGVAYGQTYRFALQTKYLAYRNPAKNPLHAYLRAILMRGVPKEVFGDPTVPSASRERKYVACEPMPNESGGTDLVPVFKERVHSELIPFPVTVHRGASHFFSQLVLESQAEVDKSFAPQEGTLMPSAMDGHLKLQDFLMSNGIAEAVEVPAWSFKIDGVGNETILRERMTCFIDALILYRNRLWIYDYKPDALQAKNKHAISQVLACRDMLHLRTGIKDIGCAFGDGEDTIVVDV